MIATNFSNARNNFKEICDRAVHDSDIATITRKMDENAVLMSQEQYETLRTLYLATGIPLAVLDKERNVLFSCLDVCLPHTSDYLMGQFQKYMCDSTHPLLLCECPTYFLALAGFEKDCFIMFGPVGGNRYDKRLLRGHLKESVYAADLDALMNVLEFGSSVSLQNVQYTLRMAIHAITGNLIPIENIYIRYRKQIQSDVGELLTQNQFELLEEKKFHTSKQYEDALMESIKRGDITVFQEEYQYCPIPGMIGRMSFDEERQKRYEFVTSIAVICRAAMRGGLDPEIAYSLADMFCQQMDRLPTPVDTGALYIHAINTYIEKVKEAKRPTGCSPEVACCRNYICQNLQSKICLEDIARQCGFTPRWISKKFEKEMGMSIPEYIQQKRLEHACHLLRYTMFSISEISNILQYSTQSYFTKKFKERYHITPKKYRDTYGGTYPNLEQG